MKIEVLEKLFIEKFPEYTVYGNPLAHYFELFKSGYELSELKIAELEDKNKWLEDCKLELADFLGKANDKIAELEEKVAGLMKENKELRGNKE